MYYDFATITMNTQPILITKVYLVFSTINEIINEINVVIERIVTDFKNKVGIIGL